MMGLSTDFGVGNQRPTSNYWKPVTVTPVGVLTLAGQSVGAWNKLGQSLASSPSPPILDSKQPEQAPGHQAVSHETKWRPVAAEDCVANSAETAAGRRRRVEPQANKHEREHNQRDQ